MKIILSHEEVSKIIRTKFCLSDDAHIIISRTTANKAPAQRPMVAALKKALEQTFKVNPGYKSEQKIAAIKYFRAIGAELGLSIGLADSKFAVENPEQAVINMETRNVIY